MKKNAPKKIILTDKELRKVVQDTLNTYLKSNDSSSNGKSGKIYGKIPDVSDFIKKMSYDNTDFIESQMLGLNEVLLKTCDVNTVRNMFCRKFVNLSNQFQIHWMNCNGETIGIASIILDRNIPNNIMGDIRHFMQSCGYFECTTPQIQNNKIVLVFEPHFTKNISDDIRRKYRFLYHATPTVYVQKILKMGLVPKSKNMLFLYHSRICCMRGNNLSKEQISVLKNVQTVRGRSPHYDNNEYTILKINVAQLPQDIKFYADPMASNAIFTHDNIPPSAICVQGKLLEREL